MEHIVFVAAAATQYQVKQALEEWIYIYIAINGQIFSFEGVLGMMQEMERTFRAYRRHKKSNAKQYLSLWSKKEFFREYVCWKAIKT